ncbi:MAG: NAD(P)-binding protein [Proteobacteria bacterium]|nr:NAD(P)-binding protein [Pseudomonadota bacterium]
MHRAQRLAARGKNMASIAIAGAGIAGISAARALQRDGYPVTLFDRGRRLGGRAAGGGYDHGAQFFTAADAEFERALVPYLLNGVIAPWAGRFVRYLGSRTLEINERRYVGVPGMGRFAVALAGDLEVSADTRVAVAEESACGWSLRDADGSELGEYDVLLLAMPPEQASALLPRDCLLRETLRAFRSEPAWAALLEFDERLPLDFDGATFDRLDIAWAARDSSKPGREPGERWVVHAAAEWSRERFGAAPDVVAEELAAAFFAATALTPPALTAASAHRWGFARVENGPACGALWDEHLRLGICGDWCVSPRIEGAWLSGVEAASLIRASVGRPRRRRVKTVAVTLGDEAPVT